MNGIHLYRFLTQAFLCLFDAGLTGVGGCV